MTKIGGILVCLVIVGLDIAAAILGIQAEVAQNQVFYIFPLSKLNSLSHSILLVMHMVKDGLVAKCVNTGEAHEAVAV